MAHPNQRGCFGCFELLTNAGIGGLPRGICGATIGSSFPSPRSRTGLRLGEKRATQHLELDYLDEALREFSGYIAADEVYDGPFCVLVVVDNRRGRRLLYEVLDHNPTQEDVERFFTRFHALLRARGLAVAAVTTDGSPLYPEPIRKVFGEVPHQICRFHVVADVTLAVLHGLAQVRKGLRAQLPKLLRGRPSRRQAKLARRKKRQEQYLAELFEHRYLFVERSPTIAERQLLRRLSRRHPCLRHLREIMDEVYGLFDRRCRTETALAKLGRLRQHVRRFRRLEKTLKNLFSPNLEKALLFLDDKLLPSTSNAVERGNRRFRKLQKSVPRAHPRTAGLGLVARSPRQHPPEDAPNAPSSQKRGPASSGGSSNLRNLTRNPPLPLSSGLTKHRKIRQM